MSQTKRVTNVCVVEAMQSLSYTRHTGTEISAEHGKANSSLSSPPQFLSYWANEQAHHYSRTRKYQCVCTNPAWHEIARNKREKYLQESYNPVVVGICYRARFLSASLHIDASTLYNSLHGFWWRGKIKQPANVLGRYVVRPLNNPGPILIDLQESA